MAPGAWLAGYIKGITKYCYKQNIKALYLLVSETKTFFYFSYCNSMGANDPRGVANLEPRGIIGRIYKGDYQTLLHTKYKSSGPHGFKQEGFFLQIFLL